MKYTIYQMMWFMLLPLALITSCKKYFDPPLIFEEGIEKPITKDRKVMLIVIDGLTGKALANHVPATIASMLPHAKYSYTGFSDNVTTDAATWTTLLGGVSSAVHGIHGDSFEEEEDEDDPHGHESSGTVVGFTTLFQRIKQSGKLYKNFAVTPSSFIDENLFTYADKRVVVSNDQQVLDSTLFLLKNNASVDLSLAVVNFTAVNQAGLANGFSLDNPSYVQAIDRVDAHIGTILETIKARETYYKEDWLFIITSNHGGIGNSYGGYSAEERNIPVIFYQSDLVSAQLDSPEMTNSLRLNNKSSATVKYIFPSISGANSPDFAINNNEEYTMMFKVKNYALPTGSNHAVILGKTNHAYSGIKGWHFMIIGGGSGNNYRLNLGDNTGPSNQMVVVGKNSAQINVWETVAVKLYKKPDGKRYARMFVNGEPGTEVDITTNRGSYAYPAAEFFIGSGDVASLGTFNGLVNNFIFINKAISDEEIQDYVCNPYVNTNTPYWPSVKGFWTMDEGVGGTFQNAVSTATSTNFIFQNSKFPWTFNAKWNCLPPVQNEGKFPIMLTDIAANIYYWLKVKVDANWGLLGLDWLKNYEVEFIDN